jgi:hypothetical protein
MFFTLTLRAQCLAKLNIQVISHLLLIHFRCNVAEIVDSGSCEAQPNSRDKPSSVKYRNFKPLFFNELPLPGIALESSNA